MTPGFKLACAYLTFAPALGIRVVRRTDGRLADELGGNDISVVCTYEHLMALMEEGEDVELGRCITEEGEAFDLDPQAIPDAVHHDKLELTLRAGGETTVFGASKYDVVEAKLLEHEKSELQEEYEIGALEDGQVSVASSGYSVLMVQTAWSDFSSKRRADIEPELNIAKTMISKGSYGSFRLGSTAWTRSSIPMRYGGIVNENSCDHSRLIREIDARTSQSSSYMYRMIFLPGGDQQKGCGWAGLATVGCGRPRNAPRAGACWSLYRGISARVQAHELGHNFGLLHAAGELRGNFVEYGDPTAIMGNQYGARSEFSASSRFALGWLSRRTGEVLDASLRRYTLSDLSAGKGIANAVAVRFVCGNCGPRQDKFRGLVGGELFFSFGYGKVMVHLARSENKGTEYWGELTRGQGWMNPYGSIAVHFCSTGFDTLSGTATATIAVDSSLSGAQGRCR